MVAIATVALNALTAWGADWGGSAVSGCRHEADSLTLSPPPFPLESLWTPRHLRGDLYECAYRQEDLRFRTVGNNSFDYPTPSGALPAFGAPPSPAASPVTPPPSEIPLEATSSCLADQAAGMNVYARVDYYYWRESFDKYRLLDESGPLVTLGIMTQREGSRLRTEIFGGQVEYDGETMDGDPLKLDTDYLGGRIQYDLLWPFQHDPDSAFVLGLGTRLWSRNLRDGTTLAGDPVIGYDEFWWMLYPTVGLETRRPMSPTSHWFASASLGVTGFTYEHIGMFDVTLYPKMGPMVQLECGMQTPRLFLSVFFEVMQWYASNAQGPDQLYQPDSMRLTAGLNAGIRF